MAVSSIAAAGLKALEDLLISPSAGGIISRAALGLLAGFGLSDLLGFNKAHPDQAHKIPRYALVDMRKDTVLVFLSRKRAYRLLLRPRSRSPKTKIIEKVFVERPDHSYVR